MTAERFKTYNPPLYFNQGRAIETTYPVKMYTYIARNTLNGKFYIGSTTDFEGRRKVHLNSKMGTPFHRALRKNPNKFEWEVFEDSSDSRELEQALLDMWYGKEMCYNLSPWSKGGVIWTSQGHCWVTNGTQEKYIKGGEEVDEGWRLGRLPMSDEAKEKLSKVNKGASRPQCATAVGRVWVTNSDRTEEVYLGPGEEIPEGWFQGRKKYPPRSEESRNKTSMSLKGKPKSNSHKENLRKSVLNYFRKLKEKGNEST